MASPTDSDMTRRGFTAISVATGATVLAGSSQAAVMDMDMKIKTPDGVCDAVLCHPTEDAPAGGWPAVLIWTDIMGLRPAFRDMGRRLAAQGYVVLVPNPFYRTRKAPVLDGPINWASPEDRAKLMALRAPLTPEAVARDAQAMFAFLDSQRMVNRKIKAGVQGYCMGGPMTFQTAAALPDRIGAVGSFHGGGLVTADADSPHLLIAKSSAAYLVAIAANDDEKDPAAKDTLKATFAAQKRPATVEVYAGAQHGWCVPGSAIYNEAAAEKAWTALLDLYKRNLV